MAKITITIEDTDTGSVRVEATGEDESIDKPTPAQHVAHDLIESIQMIMELYGGKWPVASETLAQPTTPPSDKDKLN